MRGAELELGLRWGVRVGAGLDERVGKSMGVDMGVREGGGWRGVGVGQRGCGSWE